MVDKFMCGRGSKISGGALINVMCTVFFIVPRVTLTNELPVYNTVKGGCWLPSHKREKEVSIYLFSHFCLLDKQLFSGTLTTQSVQLGTLVLHSTSSITETNPR